MVLTNAEKQQRQRRRTEIKTRIAMNIVIENDKLNEYEKRVNEEYESKGLGTYKIGQDATW